MKNEIIGLGEITPYHFGKKLIITLDERWGEYLTENSTFKVVIKDKNLMLIGQFCPITKSTASTQETF